MLKSYKIIFFGLLCFMLFTSSCKQPDSDFNFLNKDNVPKIPVTFPNMTTYGFNPYLTVSRGATPSTATFQIQISIPANSGRTIKNVLIRGGNTAINAGSLASPNYTPAVALSGLSSNMVTFSSDLTEFVSQAGQGTTVNGAISSAGYNEVAFIFKVVLDDDSEIITTQVRLRITI